MGATFGDRLRSARNAKGLTLREVYALCGFSFSHLSELENGRRRGITLGLAVVLADLYEVDLYWLATGRRR